MGEEGRKRDGRERQSEGGEGGSHHGRPASYLPLEDALKRATRDVFHEDIDLKFIHAGAQVVDHVPMSQTA